MSGVNPAQENKKGVGAKQTLSRGRSKLCSYFKKKKNSAAYLIHFVTHKALPWHFQKLSCIPHVFIR